jgi:hypothetical protein
MMPPIFQINPTTFSRTKFSRNVHGGFIKKLDLLKEGRSIDRTRDIDRTPVLSIEGLLSKKRLLSIKPRPAKNRYLYTLRVFVTQGRDMRLAQ